MLTDRSNAEGCTSDVFFMVDPHRRRIGFWLLGILLAIPSTAIAVITICSAITGSRDGDIVLFPLAVLTFLAAAAFAMYLCLFWSS
jgi:hypothetical protein